MSIFYPVLKAAPVEALRPGTPVRVTYFNRTELAHVVAYPAAGHNDAWVDVRILTGFESDPAEDRPVVPALASHVSLAQEA